MLRTPVLLLALVLAAIVAAAGVRADPAAAMASHVGWPPYELLLMNKTDSSRPLDARAGMDPFGGTDAAYSCDELSEAPSASCRPEFVPSGAGYVMTARPASHRLLGGHGNDTIHAGAWGDVIWGDYKPCCQPTTQHDRLYGGDGPDFIHASHGRNEIRSGGGMDIIHGHFGRGTIDCGSGRDVVYINGWHEKAYKLRHCEVVTTKTGVSAPKWVMRKLPWRACAAGTTYRYAACRTADDRPELDLSHVDLRASYDAGRLAARLAADVCRRSSAGALAAAQDALTILRTVAPSVTTGNCTAPAAVVDPFDFAGFLAAYRPGACGAAAAYRAVAQDVVDDLVSRWRRAVHLRGLLPAQQDAVAASFDAAGVLC